MHTGMHTGQRLAEYAEQALYGLQSLAEQQAYLEYGTAKGRRLCYMKAAGLHVCMSVGEALSLSGDRDRGSGHMRLLL